MNKKFILIALLNCLILAAVALFFFKRGDDTLAPSLSWLRSEARQEGDWTLQKTVPIDLEGAKYICLSDAGIYVASGDAVLLYNEAGEMMSEQVSFTEEKVTAIAYHQGQLYLAKQALLSAGALSLDLGKQSYITDMAWQGENLILADAGQRKVLICDAEGNVLKELKGYEEQLFKVPSPYFSLSVSAEGDLWVSDPGRLCFVHYVEGGQYRAHWEPAAEQGFLGCCNPARMRSLAGGRFVTLEKGQVRVRILSPSGAVESTLVDFGTDNTFYYDMAVRDEENILILDGKNKKILFYQKTH